MYNEAFAKHLQKSFRAVIFRGYAVDVKCLLYRPTDTLQLPTCPLYRFLSNISVNS